MQKIDVFITELQSYFGGFRNEFICQEIRSELKYIDPKYFDAILRQIKDMVPAAYLPDRKSLTDALKVLKIERLTEPNQERDCPSCGKKWYSFGGICPWCGYDKFGTDTPEEWRSFYELAKSGKKPALDFAKIIRELPRNEKREQFGKVMVSAKSGY